MFIAGIINSGYRDLEKPILGTLSYSNVVRGSVDLTCAATDNKGIKSFKIYIDSVLFTTINTTSLENFTIAGIPGSQNIDVFVVAVDVNSNESLPSNIVNFDTVIDDAPVIGTLSTSNLSDSRVTLICSATDDYSVVSFDIYQDDVLIENVVGSSLNHIVTGLLAETSYNFKVKAIDDSSQESSFSNTVNLTTSAPVIAGQVEFTTAGTHQWVCPLGVTSICVVAVGGGGGGHQYSSYSSGGSGGGLGWKNDIPVTPGVPYTVVVGSGGFKSIYSSVDTAEAGGDSYFKDTSTVKGGGGPAGGYRKVLTQGGDFVGDGGGFGGFPEGAATSVLYTRGGGGAGGYSGNGGNSSSVLRAAGFQGSGGAGGGGGNAGSSDCSGGGGGVGIYGEGISGQGGLGSSGDVTTRAEGGSGGGIGSIRSDGSTNTGTFGGGGRAADNSSNENSNGAGGAVRIIWGSLRAFPSTNTGDL